MVVALVCDCASSLVTPAIGTRPHGRLFCLIPSGDSSTLKRRFAYRKRIFLKTVSKVNKFENVSVLLGLAKTQLFDRRHNGSVRMLHLVCAQTSPISSERK